MAGSGRLSTYLNDHLAASVAAGQLAGRSARSNRGTTLGAELGRLKAEIEEDRAALRSVMNEVGASVDRVKVTGGWLAEKLGRLKLNGSLTSYSPLSRLEELELLALGVEGKLRLWRALERRDDQALSTVNLAMLIRRARSQLQRLESYRLEAVVDAW